MNRETTLSNQSRNLLKETFLSREKIDYLEDENKLRAIKITLDVCKKYPVGSTSDLINKLETEIKETLTKEKLTLPFVSLKNKIQFIQDSGYFYPRMCVETFLDWDLERILSMFIHSYMEVEYTTKVITVDRNQEYPDDEINRRYIHFYFTKLDLKKKVHE